MKSSNRIFWVKQSENMRILLEGLLKFQYQVVESEAITIKGIPAFNFLKQQPSHCGHKSVHFLFFIYSPQGDYDE